LVVVAGLGASVLAGVQWHSYIADQQRHQVATITQNVNASLSGAIQRDEDLVETLRGVVASGAALTNAQLQELYDNVSSTQNAGIVGLAYIQWVTSAQLGTFESQIATDPPLGVPTRGPSILQSEGPRPDYCLDRLVAASPTGLRDLSTSGAEMLSTALTSQFDYCAGSGGAALQAAARDGHETVTLRPESLASDQNSPVPNHLFDIIVPIYQTGLPLFSPAERSAALLGWADGLFSPLPVLSPVLAHAGAKLSIVLGYHNVGGPAQVADVGAALSDASRHTVHLGTDPSWSAVIAVVPSSASATVQAIGVLADLLVIVLLVALIMSLFRSRKKAFGAIAHKNAELHHRARHDRLTGLPNRDLILELATTMLERAERDDSALAAFLIDLDGFNAINDTYGHRVGDRVLEAVAQRLRAALGPSDALGRLAGDEFVLLADGDSLGDGAAALAARLVAQLAVPLAVPEAGAGAFVRVSARIGVAVGSGQGSEDLLRDADTALNEAKASRKQHFVIFEPAMHAAARDKLAMTHELRTAIEEHQFFLAYQPVFLLADSEPHGVEALLRWRHPTRGVVPPLEFIPLLEETGMIAEVGREVLRLACEQAKEWERRGLPMFVSVNASAIQLESDSFVDEVHDVLARTGLSPSRLTIEITESALMRDAGEAVHRLTRLKSLGIRIAIDDFGTGYSSLAYLRQFPVDVLKIDRSFISAMTNSESGMALVRTMIELGRALNLQIVAEGIEETSELSALETEHCGWGQGFLLARPLDPGQIELFFDNARGRPLAVAVAAATARHN
jgi:diguanylate cyclase (GGDEF)-like protein